MTAAAFPQPPRRDEPNFDDWLFRFWRAVVDGGLVASSGSGSGTTTTETPTAHTALSSLNTSQYTHLTALQARDLTDGGDSALHYHAADCDRANHTGTQASSTISDFATAVQAQVAQFSGALEAQVFGS